MSANVAVVCFGHVRRKLKVDVLETIDAANSLPEGEHHVNILLPPMGVAGSSLAADPWFVPQLAGQQGLELSLPSAGRRINDSVAVERSQILSQWAGGHA